MPSGDKKKRLSLKRVLWSLLLSTGIAVALLAYLEFKDAGCYIFETGQPGAFFVVGIVWVMAASFLLLRWLGRSILVVFVVVAVVFSPSVDRWPIAATQASAVGRVRRMQELLEAYRQKHPQEGFPPVIPMIGPSRFTDKTYNFEYVPIRPKKDGPAEDYFIRATPLRPECGCSMRLITSSDRIIHWNFENRPATKGDPAVPQ